MADWAMQGDGQDYQTAARVTASTEGTTIASSVTSLAWGSYTTLSSSVPFATAGFFIHLHSYSLPGSVSEANFLLQIARGSTGQEVPLVQHLLLWSRAASAGGRTIFIPVSVLSGQRISARLMSVTDGSNANTVKVSLTFLATGFTPSSGYGEVLSYGGSESSAGGVTVTSGSSHAKGSWAELTSSLTGTCSAIALSLGLGSTPAANSRFYVDIGTGTAGGERVLLPDWPIAAPVDQMISEWFIGPLPMHIPSGSRVAVRMQGSDSVSHSFQAVLLTFQ